MFPSIIKAASNHVLERSNESLHLALGHIDNDTEIDFQDYFLDGI